MPTMQTIGPVTPPPPTWLDRVRAVQVELFVLTGFVLWVVACWPHRMLAFGLPALVIVWYGMPPRPPFIARRKDDQA
jgi:hypothetical protein